MLTTIEKSFYQTPSSLISFLVNHISINQFIQYNTYLTKTGAIRGTCKEKLCQTWFRDTLEAVARKCYVKTVFLKISQYSQELHKKGDSGTVVFLRIL